MDIINEGCIKVSIDKAECRKKGISYDTFSPDSMAARSFLAALLVQLGSMGVRFERSGRVTAEVFDNGSKGLLIYLTGKDFMIEKTEAETEKVTLCRTPGEVIDAVMKAPDCLYLYKYMDCYCLIEKAAHGGDDVLAAKIKEYGQLLSDTPYESLKNIRPFR